jgi:hypothetical protein
VRGRHGTVPYGDWFMVRMVFWKSPLDEVAYGLACAHVRAFGEEAASRSTGLAVPPPRLAGIAGR